QSCFAFYALSASTSTRPGFATCNLFPGIETPLVLYLNDVTLSVFDFDGDGVPDVSIDKFYRDASNFGAARYGDSQTGVWSPALWPLDDPAYLPYRQADTDRMANARPKLSLYRDIDGDGQPELLWAYAKPQQSNDSLRYDILRARGAAHAVEV